MGESGGYYVDNSHRKAAQSPCKAHKLRLRQRTCTSDDWKAWLISVATRPSNSPVADGDGCCSVEVDAAVAAASPSDAGSCCGSADEPAAAAMSTACVVAG